MALNNVSKLTTARFLFLVHYFPMNSIFMYPTVHTWVSNSTFSFHFIFISLIFPSQAWSSPSYIVTLSFHSLRPKRWSCPSLTLSAVILQILLTPHLKYIQNPITFNWLHHYHFDPKSLSCLAVLIAVASLLLPLVPYRCHMSPMLSRPLLLLSSSLLLSLPQSFCFAYTALFAVPLVYQATGLKAFVVLDICLPYYALLPGTCQVYSHFLQCFIVRCHLLREEFFEYPNKIADLFVTQQPVFFIFRSS